jgi:hypothetical protein
MALRQAQREVIKLFQDNALGQACERKLEITINFHPDRQTADGQSVLCALAKDGCIRSQFETGTSNGGLSAFVGGDRWNWESRAFSGLYDNAQPSDRPKYGALNYQQHGAGASPRFGSSFFKLKSSVLDRTTFCYPESWVGPKAFAYAGYVQHLIDLADADELDVLDSYIEAHIHGDLVVRTDVESIVLDPCFQGTSIEAAACQLGCKVEWHNGFMAQVSKLEKYPEYRGEKYVQLACEIAREGVITPEIIGEAVNRKLYNEQDLKKVWHYLARFGNLN